MSDWRRTFVGAFAAASIASIAVVAGCGGSERQVATDTAGGEVAALEYEVTPDRYERWVAAQQSLDAITGLPAPPKVDPMRLGEADISRAVAYLEADARARAALSRAGISARDYVLTTVALDQALVSAAAADAAAAGGDPVAAAPPGAGPATTVPSAAGRAPSTSDAGGASTRAASASSTSAGAPGQPRPRITGAPAQNVELVRRNRADVVRVLRTMRFRISEPAATDLAEVADTAVTRSDSVRVGKDVTVKWDVTVRRNRDTTGAKQRSSARLDSARRDSTKPDSSLR